MKNFLAIAVFTVVVSLFYTWVGSVLPQLESRPPVTIDLGSTVPPDELVEAGAGVFDANCAQCHAIGSGGRCPDMAGMGRKAKDRAAERASATGNEYDDIDYLLETLCDPGVYLTEGFGNIMPPQGKLLEGGQMLAVVAFMQDQGGDVTAQKTLADKAASNAVLERFGCGSSGGGGGGGGGAVASLEPAGPPEEAFVTFGCNVCHSTDKPDRLLGPTLQGIGERLSRAEIYESILDPDAKLTEADPPYAKGLMKATLDGNGFYERMTPADYKAMVDWIGQF